MATPGRSGDPGRPLTGSPATDRESRGVLYGLGAYVLWGVVPLFWPLVARAGALEILAHRVVWSLAFAAILALAVVPRGWWAAFRSPRNLALASVASVVVAVNWGTYIYGVTSGQVVETALGYYLNPILSVLVGVLLLRERLAAAQWVAVGLVAVAVVVLTVGYGRPPWIALVLAVSWTVYGVVKKRLNAGAVETLTVESALLTPVAVAYLVVLQTTGSLTFGHLGWGHSLLLVATGLVTGLPLLLFAAAATRVPLSTLGLLQYVAPTLQFGLGVLYFREPMPAERWVGFGLVWVALVILGGYGLSRVRAARKSRLLAVEGV